MLTHPPLDTLQALKLMGRYHALLEQMQMPEITEVSCEERLGLLVDRESTAREDRRLKTRLPQAKPGKPPVSRISTLATHAGWPRR